MSLHEPQDIILSLMSIAVQEGWSFSDGLRQAEAAHDRGQTAPEALPDTMQQAAHLLLDARHDAQKTGRTPRTAVDVALCSLSQVGLNTIANSRI